MPLQPRFKAAKVDEHINLAALPATLASTEIRICSVLVI
jgi:hypothetical protein